MKRIAKNLLVYWKYLGGALLLFLVQIYCITGIAEAVHGMRNTGAQKSGIEYMVSEALAADAWKNVELYMSDSEKSEWSNCYEKAEDGLYYLNDSMKGEKSLRALEQKFMIPQAIVGKLSQMKKEELRSLMGEADSPFAVDYMEIRDLMEGELEAEGDKKIQAYALQFVREQSEAAGVDLQKKTTQYIWGAVFQILVYMVVLAGSIAGMLYLTGSMERVIGRWIQEPEIRQAEQLLACVFCIMMYAVFLYWNSFAGLGQNNAGAAWYAAGVILLIGGLAGVWLLRTRPKLENIYQRIAWTGHRRQKYIKWMNRVVVAGIPGTALLMGVMAAVSPDLACMLLLFLADMLLIAGAFLLPEIASAADCVEET